MTQLPDVEVRELKQGLVAAIVGAGVDDSSVYRLVRAIEADPDALESVIRSTLENPERLAAVDATGLIADGPQRALDDVASLTAEALAAPMVAITIIDADTQLLAGCNIASPQVTRVRAASTSISKLTVAAGIPFIVDDARVHPLLSAHPSVVAGEVGAYAGVPLFSDHDQPVGALSAWNARPHLWTGGQIMVLQDMADLASAKVFGRPI
ncbi:GAF domain-containing protein [Mycolicibacterium sp. 3033]|nr:GAF domain-containing protein [Mycolicibacterium aurantiacum]